MKVPKKVQIIGHVQNIAWVPTKSRSVKDMSWWNGECIIAVNLSLTILYLFPNDVKDINETNAGLSTKFKSPNGSLKKLGHAFQITYESNLWEDRDQLYYHDFEKEKASFWGNKINNPTMIAIKYPKGRIVTDRGIV